MAKRTNTKTSEITPAVGQIWKANDPRSKGRKVRVLKLVGKTAQAENVSTGRKSTLKTASLTRIGIGGYTMIGTGEPGRAAKRAPTAKAASVKAKGGKAPKSPKAPKAPKGRKAKKAPATKAAAAKKTKAKPKANKPKAAKPVVGKKAKPAKMDV